MAICASGSKSASADSSTGSSIMRCVSRFSGGNSRFNSSCRRTDATALFTPST